MSIVPLIIILRICRLGLLKVFIDVELYICVIHVVNEYACVFGRRAFVPYFVFVKGAFSSQKFSSRNLCLSLWTRVWITKCS